MISAAVRRVTPWEDREEPEKSRSLAAVRAKTFLRPLAAGKRATGLGMTNLTWLCGFMAVEALIASGAGHVDDDAPRLELGSGRGCGLVLDGGEGAEEKAAGVSHDGGAARSDFVVGQEFVEFAEGAIDLDGRAEFAGVTDQPCGLSGLRIGFALRSGVAEAKTGLRIGDGHSAKAAAGSRAMLTADGCRAGCWGFGIHEGSFRARSEVFFGQKKRVPFWEELGYTPGIFPKSGK